MMLLPFFLSTILFVAPALAGEGKSLPELSKAQSKGESWLTYFLAFFEGGLLD